MLKDLMKTAVHNMIYYVKKRYELKKENIPTFEEKIYNFKNPFFFKNYVCSTNECIFMTSVVEKSLGIQQLNLFLKEVGQEFENIKTIIIIFGKCTPDCLKQSQFSNFNIEMYLLYNLQVNIFKHEQYPTEIEIYNSKKELEEYYGKLNYLKRISEKDKLVVYLKLEKNQIIRFKPQDSQITSDFRIVV